MKVIGRILSETDQARIHEQSLRILSDVGVRFHSAKALPILQKQGAWVD